MLRTTNIGILFAVYVLSLVTACKPSTFTTTFSADAAKFARGYPGGFMVLYDVPVDFDSIKIEPHDFNLSAVTFSPDGTVVATGGSHWLPDDEIAVAEVAIFDAETGEELIRFPVGDQEKMNAVYALAISPSDPYIAVGSGDTYVYIIDLVTGDIISTLDTSEYGVFLVAYSSDGSMLVTYNLGKRIIVWDMITYKPAMILEEKNVSAMAVSPFGYELAIAVNSGDVKLYDIRTGELEKTIPKFEDGMGGVCALAYDVVGTQIAMAGCDEKIRLWDILNNEQIGMWEYRALRLAFSPNGKFLIYANEEDIDIIKLWGQ